MSRAGKLRFQRRHGIAGEVQTIETVEAERCPKPQVAVGGLGQGGDVSGRSVASHPLHVSDDWLHLGGEVRGDRPEALTCEKRSTQKNEQKEANAV